MGRSQSEADKRYRAKHKELYRKAAKDYARKTKAIVLDAYGINVLVVERLKNGF